MSNYFKILSITDTRFDEAKEWYDGYRFGNADWLVKSNAEAITNICKMMTDRIYCFMESHSARRGARLLL